MDRYRNAESKEEKREMETLINTIKSDFRSEIAKNDPKIKRKAALGGELYNLTMQTGLFEEAPKDKKIRLARVEKVTSELNKLESEIEEIKANQIFENAFEWRFEFPEVLNDAGEYVGFDVVIGNPPYIYNRDLENVQRDFFKTKYKQADDLYIYFTYEAKKIIKSKGFITLITPNTYFTLSSREKFREFLLKENYQKYTYSGYCFEDAYVETMILEISNNNKKKQIVFVPNPNDFITYISYNSDPTIFEKNIFKRFFIPTSINLKINYSINLKLQDLSKSFIEPLKGKKTKEKEVINYRKNLKELDLTYLGLISEGEQGLVTGNNSKYIAQIVNDSEESEKIQSKFFKELKRNGFNDLSYKELIEDIEYFYQKAEEIKRKKSKPDIFGKFFIYKQKYRNEVIQFNQLSTTEKLEGGENQTWVNYYKGNTDGLTWRIPFNEAILWSKESVKELSEGKVTNSRWQGNNFFKTTGFAWVDYFTNRIKSFFVDEGIYSKNIVKLHSTIDKVPDKYIVACLNSKFISYYVKNFITSTHTLQINDGRLIPIIIPPKNQLDKVIRIVERILYAKEMDPRVQTVELEAEIDKLVYEIYGLSEEEIEIVEGG